ncbi:hypothetical protein [Echinicola sp. 20G]|uniref:hypothetical protein n=1 Tax=Echinicola sp. 20G TaxID=2781961 RepID=UPI001910E269|nr:hypothetical protein [Echinicola sp. 20G]
MNWLWVILAMAAIGGIIGFLSSNENRGESAAQGAVMGSVGCGYIIFQIMFALIGLWLLITIGSWLFG